MAENEDQEKKPDETPENRDLVWNIVPDDSELAAFKKIWRRRLIIHLCCVFVAALLFGVIVYSGVFDPPAHKMKPEFVKQKQVPPTEKNTADHELERIRKAMADTADPAALEILQKDLSVLLKGTLKDNPDALKLHFELTEKIRAAGSGK